MTDFRPGSFQVLPPIVKNIIIINVLMVLIQFVLGKFGINLADYLGLHYWQSPLFRWWQPLTHMFMHGAYNDVGGTVGHIFFNMFALWMFGSVLENIWGPKRFLIFYLICGLGAAFCHLIVLHIEFSKVYNTIMAFQNNPSPDQYLLFLKQHNLVVTNNDWINSWMTNPNCVPCANEAGRSLHEYYTGAINEPTVGASGAVFGVLFAFGYLFPNTYLYLFFAVPIKAKWAIGAYIVIELYEGIKNSAGDNVAHFAHLGGALFAFILLKIWNKKIRNQFY